VNDTPSSPAGSRLPSWLGSIRFRIALAYSTVLFGLAALVIGALYWATAASLDDSVYRATLERPTPGGIVVEQLEFITVEQAVNQKTLETLRRYSLASLGVLFVTSLGVGWVVAGRVLRPIGRITEVAREIQATDLSRRIELGGPDDELRRLADTFDEMLGRLDEAFESQRRFIHEASHELRNPLAVIRTNLDVCLSDPDATVEDLRRTGEIVRKSTERMARLVDDLLVYARQGTLSLERSRFDAAELVAEAAEEFATTAAERHIRLEVQAPAGLWVDGDRLALRQALANLLANAVRVSPAGSTIRVSAGAQPPWVWMAVQDEGPGIAPEDAERVFQRFWRGDGPGGAADGRSGLGLTIVRQIAEAHGGQVKLASEPGRGAAFALWLPAPAAARDLEPVTGGPGAASGGAPPPA
jgi:signal transduction histidine kinase